MPNKRKGILRGMPLFSPTLGSDIMGQDSIVEREIRWLQKEQSNQAT
jgi:hypothetical protein